MERAILSAICQEYSSKQIADQLGLSLRTVEKYRSNILKKTGAMNTAGMVVYAIRHEIYSI